MRDKLIELVNEFKELDFCIPPDWWIEHLADHLLANGVIVPPCKVGAKVYTCRPRGAKEWKVHFVGMNTRGEIKFHLADETFSKMIDAWNYDIGKTVFLTREDAEKALKGGAK